MFLVFHNLQGNYLTIYLPILSIIWLERYLQTWKSTILVVSHDRSFLDEVPTDILHLHSQKIDTYKVGGTPTRQLTRQEEQQPDNLQGRRNTNQTTYKVGETPTRQLTRQEEQQPDNLQGMRNNNQTNYKVGGTTTRQITRQEEQQPYKLQGRRNNNQTTVESKSQGCFIHPEAIYEDFFPEWGKINDLWVKIIKKNKKKFTF